MPQDRPAMRSIRCNVLLVSPRFAGRSFWNLTATCEALGAKTAAPPLGLITVAAMLPKSWECRLVNRNAEELVDADLQWADMVMTGGMIPQRPDALAVIELAQARGKPVVVGGPDVTSAPEAYAQADFQVLGEAEGVIEAFIEAWSAGSITGRYANRIGGAQFTLNGQTYHLIANNGPNTLHGGPNALDHRVWTVSPLTTPNGVAATLSYASPDGDQNFPGTLTTQVTYTLTNDDVLQIVYVASTDKDTVINFTNHSYINLAGNGSGSITDQLLLVNADRYTPTGPDQIPTGEIAPVESTPLDFRQMIPIGARLHSAFQQIVYARGYDHNFVLNKPTGGVMSFAARAYDPRSGRLIDCFTSEPGVQVYTSNGMNGSIIGSSGSTYRQTEGFTLETQHFPDSPNKPNFPSTELKPGQEFRSTTIFHFATDASLPPLPR